MVYGVVLAGGVGSRMGGDKPKQYLTVKDKPIIIYTIEKFISVPQLEKILVLCPSKWVEHTKNLIAKHIAPAADRVAVIEGGSTRNETIMNAIRYIENEGNLNDDTIIVTHDSVRPFVTYRIIEENIAAAEQFGACDTVIPATDTIVESRHVSGSDSPVLPRHQAEEAVRDPHRGGEGNSHGRCQNFRYQG